MRPLSEKSKKIILLSIVSAVLASSIYSSIHLEQYSQSYRYRHPMSWWYLQYGSSAVNRFGIIEVHERVIVLGSTEKDVESGATWIIFFPEYKSLLPLEKEVYVIIPASIWGKLNNSVAQLYFNDYRIEAILNRPVNIEGLGFVFAVDKDPDEEDGCLHYYIPMRSFKEENLIKLVLPYRTVAYINPITVTVIAHDIIFNSQLSQMIAIMLLIPYSAIVVYTINKVRHQGFDVVLMLTAAWVLRLIVAPYTEHVFDLEVAKRQVKLLYGSGVVNIATLPYGPLWSFMLYLSASPVFLFGSLPGDLLLNLALKIPAIAADSLVFILLVKMLSKKYPREKCLNLAAWGWLFNPLIVWFSSFHGSYSSLVAMFIMYAIYYLRENLLLGSLFASVGTGFLWPVGLTFPVFAIRAKYKIYVEAKKEVNSLNVNISVVDLEEFLAIIVFIGFFALVCIMPYVFFESGIHSLIYGPLFQSVIGRGVLESPSISTMSYQFIMQDLLGFHFETSLATVIALIAATLFISRIGNHVLEEVVPAIVFGFTFFYAFYPGLYNSHIIWIIPLLILTLTYRGLKPEVVTKLSLLYSLYFWAMSLVSEDAWRGIIVSNVTTAVSNALVELFFPITSLIYSFSAIEIFLFLYWILEAMGTSAREWAMTITKLSKPVSVSSALVVLVGLLLMKDNFVYTIPAIGVLTLMILLYAFSFLKSKSHFLEKVRPLANLGAAQTILTVAMLLRHSETVGMIRVMDQILVFFSFSSMIFLGGWLYLKLHHQ